MFKLTPRRNWIALDAESVGLYGDIFQVGWVVADCTGEIIEMGFLGCPLETARGSDEDRKWVQQNVIPATSGEKVTCTSPFDLRQKFWAQWEEFKKRYTPFWIFADCPFPVEARLFEECVKDDVQNRKWKGPYPLLDVGTVLFARDIDPTTEFERRRDELPKHHPTKDALQSLRTLLWALKKECQNKMCQRQAFDWPA
jgi:hypothetical protein